MKLSEIWASITSNPIGEPNEFSAVPIPGITNHRLAKDVHGRPVLLLLSGGVDRVEFSPPIRLQNIAVDFDLTCKVKHGTKLTVETFSALCYVGVSPFLESYFFKLSKTLLENLGDAPNKRQIRDEIYQLVELLRFASETPQKTVQGLWAELFLMSIQEYPETLLQCWHSTPEDKFDFSNGLERLEVKSCAGRTRIHSFSIEQLNPPVDVSAFVASVFVVKASNGQSIRDLEATIASRVNGQVLKEKLRMQIGKTLGSELNGADMEFDSQVAAESLQFYRVEDVPRILSASINPEITQVKFQSNLTKTPSIASSELSHLFEQVKTG